MIVGPDFINSISENNIDISSAWIFTDVDAYSYDYKEVMLQPISSEAVPLTYLKFKVPVTNIEIRSGNTQTSPLLFAGVSFNIADNESGSSNTNSSIQQLSTGVVGISAPNAVYGAGIITIDSAHINLCDNPYFQGKIETYLVTSATFTLTNGAEQFIVADYNSGSPIYRLENDKTLINSSNIVLIRVCWRTGNVVHSIDYDAAGSGLANKIEASIIQTTPYRKSLDGGLTLSETSSPIERTVIVTSSVVFAGTTPHTLSAFNSSSNKLTFASVANGVWSYTSGTTQYNNTQYNPATGLSTLGNNNYGVVWFYRSVGNDVEVFYVLGSEEYPSLAKAETARMRSDLSLLLRDHCILCGRIIIQKGATSGVVENVSDVSFASSQITNHNDLQNLQGGSAATSEYYHLSAATYNKLTSGFNPAVRGLFSGTSPITYTSATGAISHSTIGSAGTYTKVVTNATGHVTFGSVLTSADIPSLDASKITTGTIDVARIPVLPSQVPQVTTNLASLTTAQQNIITSGTVVTTSDDGWRYVYSGTGSKTTSASYVILADISPEWAAIANRPTNVSTWSNDAGYLTNTTGDARYSLTGHNHNGLYLTSTSALNPANVTQTSSYRFVTDTEKNTWNAKQNAITLGTTAQYFRGDLSLATFPTNLSSFTNGPGYLTSSSSLSWSKVTGTPTTLAGYGVAASDSLFASINAGTATKLQTARTIAGVSFDGSANISIPYANLTSIPSTFTPAAHNQAWNTITGTPTTLAGYGITDAVSSSDSRLTDTRTPTNQSWYVIGDNASCTRSGSGTNSQNTLRKSGFYSYQSWADSPVANTWTHLIHNQYINDAGSTNTWSFDIAANFGTVAYPGSAENYYMRCIAGGTSTGWRKLWHDGNFTPGNYLQLAGGTMSGNLLGSTSYNIGASSNWWGNGYFDNLYAQNNLVWHAGNLIGNITGHYHSADRAWANLTGVPNIVQNPQSYFLPLSGGTLTGDLCIGNNYIRSGAGGDATIYNNNTNFYFGSAGVSRGMYFQDGATNVLSWTAGGNPTFTRQLNGTAATFTDLLIGAGLKLGYYSNVNYSGIWSTGVTKDANNWAFLTDTTNMDTYLNAKGSLELQIFDGTQRNSRVSISNTTTTISNSLVGTTASFTGSASFNNSIQKPWTTLANPIGFGGECGVYTYNGVSPSIFANVYHNGTNWKWYNTATNTRYARILQLAGDGSLEYSTSITSPTADANITDLTLKFSVSKEGNGFFAGTLNVNGPLNGTTASFTGSISSKYSSLDTNYFSINGTYASWGHKSATGQTDYAILQNSTGTSTFLNAGTTLHLQVSNDDVATLTSASFGITKNLSVSQSAETAISVNASNSGYSRAFTALNSGLTAGGYYASLIGVALSNYNSGYIRFNYAGSGSTSNAMSLGLYGADNLLTITKDSAAFSGTISEGGTLLSSKYGQLSANNTWSGTNTFGNTVDFGTQAVKFGEGFANIKWGTNGLIGVATVGGGNNMFRAGNGYWSFSPDTYGYNRIYSTTTMYIAGGLEVTGKTYLTNYLRLSNGPTIAPIAMAATTYNLAQPSEAGQMVIIHNTNGGPATTVTLTSSNSSFMGRTEGGSLFYVATTLTHRCCPILLIATSTNNWEVMNTFGCVSAV